MPKFQDDGSGGPSGPVNCGADKELFVEKANGFIPATLRLSVMQGEAALPPDKPGKS